MSIGKESAFNPAQKTLDLIGKSFNLKVLTKIIV
nr:MAG TPA: hypothetical protein [Caudoviricetes sp.]